MNRFFVVVFVFCFFNFIGFSQNTQEKGTVFFSGGVGKSWVFSPSYSVNESSKLTSSLSDDILAPQLTANIGYVFANHFAVELTADRFLWNYNPSFPFTNDVLYTRIGFFGMDKWYKTNKSEFASTWIVGLSGGPVLSNNHFKTSDLRFGENALNGFGTNLLGGLRFEFQKRFYLLYEQTLGIISQTVKGENTKINLHHLYSRANFSLGFFIYERWNESCNTCPKW